LDRRTDGQAGRRASGRALHLRPHSCIQRRYGSTRQCPPPPKQFSEDLYRKHLASISDIYVYIDICIMRAIALAASASAGLLMHLYTFPGYVINACFVSARVVLGQVGG
jgi:hypothetical protein